MPIISIHPDVMPFLAEKAKQTGKSITSVIDDILRALINKQDSKESKSYTCHNCRNPVDYEINAYKGYCDYCESVVFIDKN